MWYNKIKTAEDKVQELTAAAVELTRRAEIAGARESAGLKKVTIEQAHNFIDNKMDSAATVAQVKEAIRDILKKMVPYLLD